MILLIDNYDSFTFNLYQGIAVFGADLDVVRNDEFGIAELLGRQPRGLVISPGPGRPENAGVSVDLLRRLAARPDATPALGVCLGHQCLAAAFGGRIVQARELRHGKTSNIHHDGRGLFDGMPSPFVATRYHSLAVDDAAIPNCLEVSAWTADGQVMGLRHRERPMEGVQFHPESILTPEGPRLLANFAARAGAPVRETAHA